MASKGYGYQYETSPRKIEHEYNIPKKTKKKVQKPKIKSQKLKEKQKAKELKTAYFHFGVIIGAAILCVLFVMYRTVHINESFSEIQAMTRQISEIEKVNSQILVNVQNSLNLSTIETAATTTLGMQKLSSKQTVYITLDKKDYVEPNVNMTVEEKGFLEKIVDKIF